MTSQKRCSRTAIVGDNNGIAKADKGKIFLALMTLSVFYTLPAYLLSNQARAQSGAGLVFEGGSFLTPLGTRKGCHGR